MSLTQSILSSSGFDLDEESVRYTTDLVQALSKVPKYFKLNDGHQHPVIGYGTYKVGITPGSAGGAGGKASGNAADAKAIIENALAAGYRMFDCAEFYANEAFVGQALAGSGVPRKELYLVSKVWTTTIYKGAEAVKQRVLQTLKDLQTDYLDMYLIHWPVPEGKHVEAYKALIDLQKAGRIRSIGVSNYTVEDYKELMQHVSVPPATNQIEINPFLYRRTTIDFFQSQGVLMESYRSLRNGTAFTDPTLVAMAKKYKRAVTQIMGRWCLQKGCVYMPKSVNRGRMEENSRVFDFEISDKDMDTLDHLTTDANIATFKGHYVKNCVRDCPLEGKGADLKGKFTLS